MPSLTIVSGAYGKGPGSYDQETFSLPKDVKRPVDEIEVHGSVAGKEDEGWASDILRSLKSGLSIASNFGGPAAIAAGALTSGLSTLDDSKDAPRALLDITFRDGAQIVALAHPALAASSCMTATSSPAPSSVCARRSPRRSRRPQPSRASSGVPRPRPALSPRLPVPFSRLRSISCVGTSGRSDAASTAAAKSALDESGAELQSRRNRRAATCSAGWCSRSPSRSSPHPLSPCGTQERRRDAGMGGVGDA